MAGEDVIYLTEGARFSVSDITFWADSAIRTVADAIADAELLVSCPDSAPELPAELAPWVHPDLTRQAQLDMSSVTSRLLARRWAEIDPSIIYVENPHPTVVTHPWTATAVLRLPVTEADARELSETLLSVAEQGATVYRDARLELVERLLRVRQASSHRPFTTLSLRDSMTRPGMPAVVSLANRGDAAGNPRPAEPAITMDPERLRLLADSHRTAFTVRSHDEVALNTSHAGGEEIRSTAGRFGLGAERVVDAVQADFRREYLRGPSASEADPDRIDDLARRLRRTWQHYRSTRG